MPFSRSYLSTEMILLKKHYNLNNLGHCLFVHAHFFGVLNFFSMKRHHIFESLSCSQDWSALPFSTGSTRWKSWGQLLSLWSRARIHARVLRRPSTWPRRTWPWKTSTAGSSWTAGRPTGWSGNVPQTTCSNRSGPTPKTTCSCFTKIHA